MIDKFVKRTENNTSAWLAFSQTADELWKIRGWGNRLQMLPVIWQKSANLEDFLFGLCMLCKNGFDTEVEFSGGFKVWCVKFALEIGNDKLFDLEVRNNCSNVFFFSFLRKDLWPRKVMSWGMISFPKKKMFYVGTTFSISCRRFRSDVNLS